MLLQNGYKLIQIKQFRFAFDYITPLKPSRNISFNVCPQLISCYLRFMLFVIHKRSRIASHISVNFINFISQSINNCDLLYQGE